MVWVPLIFKNRLREKRDDMKNLAVSIVMLLVTCCLVCADNKKEESLMRIASPAFGHNVGIPKKYTCDGGDINPPLEISDVPANARSLALIVDDPDAPMGIWVNWVVYDIPVVSRIDENNVPGIQGANDFGRQDYGGPCPPSGRHRYFFKVYALDIKLNVQEGVAKQDLEKMMEGHIVAKAELVGLYERKR